MSYFGMIVNVKAEEERQVDESDRQNDQTGEYSLLWKKCSLSHKIKMDRFTAALFVIYVPKWPSFFAWWCTDTLMLWLKSLFFKNFFASGLRTTFGAKSPFFGLKKIDMPNALHK